MINQAKLKELLNYDSETGILYWNKTTNRRIKVGDVAGCKDAYGYLVIRFDGKLYKAHRLAWLYVYGVLPDQIDHINGIRDDNRIVNLRSVTIGENNKNTKVRQDNISGVAGVHFEQSRSKWLANISVEGKNVYLGRFNTFDEAVHARKSAEIEYSYHDNHGRCI